jgi:uncharacterized membrane protein YfcA
MLTPLVALQAALAAFTAYYLGAWYTGARAAHSVPDAPAEAKDSTMPNATHLGIGLVTNFFDTLGIGSFAPTTAIYKFFRIVPDRLIPGTLNVGHTIPTIIQAFIYTAAIEVDQTTLILMIGSAVAGAWLGANIVAGWPKRNIQLGMGFALLVAAALFAWRNLGGGGTEAGTTGLEGTKLALGMLGNFGLGALMTLGIGMYAPCMILVGLLGMNAAAAFPIMMGSCAFLMPVASARFVKKHAYARRPALGLAIGGIPGVLLAAYIFTSLPIYWVRWLVVGVVLIAATMMLNSAFTEKDEAPKNPKA